MPPIPQMDSVATHGARRAARSSLFSIALIVVIAGGGSLCGQRGTLVAQPMGKRLRDAVKDGKKLKQLVEQTIDAGAGPSRSLQLLIDKQGAKQLNSYLKQFQGDIENSPRIERLSIVGHSKLLQQRRSAVLRLGRASYQLRDALRLKKPESSKSRPAVGQSSEKAEDSRKTSFDSFLESREEILLKSWLEQRGFGEISATESNVIEALNRIRAANNMPAFQVDHRLQLAARGHSADMAKRHFFSHVSPIAGRKTYVDRAAQFDTRCLAENIGKGDSPQLVIQLWLRSKNHRRNILDPRHTAIGVGVSGKKYTTMFGSIPRP